MSRHITGSLWPYRERKNFSVSSKNIFTVQSSSPTATSSLSYGGEGEGREGIGGEELRGYDKDESGREES